MEEEGVWALSKSYAPREIACRCLSSRVQSLQKCDERCRLRRVQVLSVRRHVSAALNHLANELIFGETNGHTIESRTPLPADVAERMAVAALLDLENECTLSLRSAVVPRRNFAGTGSPLHAFMCGLQGANPARCVNVPNVMAMSRTDKTAIGLRRQLFSPSPERNGRSSRRRITRTGPMRRAGVSIEGGKRESSAYIHKKK